MAGNERGTGRITRRIAPRNRSNYSNSKDGLSTGGGVRTSDKCFNTAVHNLQVIYPRSDDMVFFRPFAALDPTSSEPRLLPGRESLESFGQSEWIIRVPVCKFVGTCEKHQVSYVLYGPGEKDQKANDPYVVLYNTMFQAKERGTYGRGQRWNPRWAALMKGGRKESPKISPPDHIWAMQGLCYAAGDKVYVSERGRTEPLGATAEDPLTVMVISAGAGRALLRLLDTPRKNIESVDEVDLDSNYKYGSAVGTFNEKSGCLEGGLIVGVFRPNGRTQIAELPPFNPASGKKNIVTSFDGKLKDIIGYEVTLHRSIMLDRARYTSSLSELQTDANFNKAQFFFGDGEHDDGIFKVLSLEQKLEYLALAFRDTPALLEFAWFGRPEFRTPEVKKILSNAVSSVSPLDDDDEDAEPVVEDERSARRGTRSARGKSRRRDDAYDDDDFDDERTRRRSPVANRKDVVDDLEDDDIEDDLDDDFDEDNEVEAPKAKPRQKPARDSSASRRLLGRLDTEEFDDEEFEEDDEPEFSVGKSKDDDTEDDDVLDDDVDDEDVVDDEDDVEDDVEDDDVEDDVEDEDVEDDVEDDDVEDDVEDEDVEDDVPVAPARKAPAKEPARTAVPAKQQQREQKDRERELQASLEASMLKAQEATDTAAQRSARRGKVDEPAVVEESAKPAKKPRKAATKEAAEAPAKPAKKPATKPAAPESRGGSGRRRK